MPGPGAEPVQGHRAIEAALTWFLALGGPLWFTPRQWLVCGDIAFSSTTFDLHGGTDPDGNPAELHGVTSEVLRRQPDGT